MAYVSSRSGEACKLLYPSLLYFALLSVGSEFVCDAAAEASDMVISERL